MDALIGHTGFVGRNLLNQARFDLLVHRQNLPALAGARLRRMVICGLPAEKWRANLAPAEDLANMRRLQAALENVSEVRQVVLISTVDVYPTPSEVDEDTPLTCGDQCPYGEHRLAFERWLSARFTQCRIIRLPGLFGPGLKKNVLFDLLHDNQVERLRPDAEFQWYPIQRLAADVELLLALGLPLVNASTEPLSTAMLAQRFFPSRRLPQRQTGTAKPVRYDVRSRHAEAFGGHDGHWLSRVQVLDELQTWLASEPAWCDLQSSP